MRYFEMSSVFHYPWEQVAEAFWKRYPNPESTHVLSEDTVFREVRGHQLFSKRVFTKTNRVPKWGERFVSAHTVKILEESVVDPREQVLVTYTRNLGYVRVMSVVEKVVYRASSDNPGWTVAERSAWVDSHVFGFARAIQAFGMERFRKNCLKMTGGFNHVLAAMFPHAAPPGGQASAPSSKDTLRDAAKRAGDLAKAKAGPLYASIHANKT
ncbi:PRELI domain-containing protein 1, mitochondrial [Bacillus rossius redtenbacheri]|uniref:PRELI domain-containing protein 1, mitochondrial n=1 Tax=Bacillus rossius redtenbacheri TaxID=93214 RepID=UPI002FDCC1CC